MAESELEVDANLVLSKRIKLRTIGGAIIGTDLQVFECEDPYVLIFVLFTDSGDEVRMDIFKNDLSKELKVWLEGKYIRNPAVLIPSRIEDSIMKFIKFARTPKQEDLMMWILSRCEYYPTRRNTQTQERIGAEIIFGGRPMSEQEQENFHNRLTQIKKTLVQNQYPKTSILASGLASKDDSHYHLPSEHQDEDDNDQSRRTSSKQRSQSAERLRSKSLTLEGPNKDVFQQAHEGDLGMFALTKKLLGKSQTIQTIEKQSTKGRTDSTKVVNTANFSHDHWRLYNEIVRTRKDIKNNLNERRKLIEIAKTRQLQKTGKLSTIKNTIKLEKGQNKFVKDASYELSTLKQIESNIIDDLKQQKIRITRSTQKVLWTMAPPGFANLRGKSQRGAVIGPGPLPPNATSDLKDPDIEATMKRCYWDTAGRRHYKSHGIDQEGSDESLLEQAMNAIRRLAQNISAYKLDLKAVFESFDTSGDGFLSAEEMAEAFLAMGVKLDIPTMMAIYKHFDPNNSGSVHYGEFVWAFFNRRKIIRQWKQKTKGMTTKQIQSMFHQYDTTGNGSLSYNEFQRLLTKVFHMDLNKQEIETLIDQFDVNQDGEIDINEFLVFIQSEQKNFDEAANNPNATLLDANRRSVTAVSGRRSPSPPSQRPVTAGDSLRRSKTSTRSHQQPGAATARPSSAPRLRGSSGRDSHNRTAPGVLEGHRIHSSAKKPPSGRSHVDRIDEVEGEDEEPEHYDDHVVRVKEQLEMAKKKLHQTESNIHLLQKQNAEMKKENQKPELNNNDITDRPKQQAQQQQLSQSLDGGRASTGKLSEQADVMWMTRMLQAQAEIEGRLGTRYYKNH